MVAEESQRYAEAAAAAAVAAVVVVAVAPLCCFLQRSSWLGCFCFVSAGVTFLAIGATLFRMRRR